MRESTQRKDGYIMVSQSKDITVEYDCHIHVSLKDCHLMTILAAFAVLLPALKHKVV